MLALITSLLGVGSSAGAENDLFAQAAAHYRQQQWAPACAAFAKLLAENPAGEQAAKARFFYGEALVQLGRWGEARQQFSTLLHGDPAGPHARQSLFRAGEAAYMTGDRRAAGDDLRAFHRRYPDDPLDAYVLPYLGSLEIQSGNAAAAEQLFSEAAARFPAGPLAAETQFGWAQSLHQAGQLEAARDKYREVIKGGGELAEGALLQLGTAENARGRYAAALAAFDELAAEFPVSALADKGRLGRGFALFKLDRFREAADVLEPLAGHKRLGTEAAYWLALAQKGEEKWQAAVDTLRRIDADEAKRLAPAIAFHTADALLHDGQLPAAQEEFARAAGRFPDSPWADDALLGQLHIAVEQEQLEESVRLADELMSRFPDSPLVHRAALAKGQALAALDKPFAAGAELDKLLKTLPSDDAAGDEIRSRAQATLAVCRAKLDDFDGARRMLDQLAAAKTADTLTSETTYQIAELALESGHEALAEELFAAVAVDDGAAEVARRAQSGLAWSHFRGGRYDEAAAAFARLLESDPNGPMAAEAALLSGRALEHLERFDEALARYKLVVDDHADSSRVAEALAGCARLYERLDQPDLARTSYAELVANHPRFSQLDVALYHYAWLLRTTDPNMAGRMFERVRTEFPDSQFAPAATLRLAEGAFERQQYEDAALLLADVTRAETPDSVRLTALYLSGRMELARGKWMAAVAPLERLIVEFPNDELAPSSQYLIGEAEFRQGQYEATVERLAQLAAKTSGRTETWLATAELRRAQALAHLRRWNEAIDVARGISERFGNFDSQYEVDYTIGRALAAQADFAGAREQYAKVIASPQGAGSETAAMAQWMIGESYFHQQDYQAALAEYQKVDQLHPRWHAAALLQAGKSAEALGQRQTAVELYQRLLDMYPQSQLSAEATRRLTAAGRSATTGRGGELK